MAGSDDVMSGMLEELAQSLDAIRSPDSLMSFLGQATVFWRYSASNILMLTMQAQERGVQPTLVAGFNEWKREGRAPRKGQHGFKILAPIASRGYELRLADGSVTRVGTKKEVPADATITRELSGTTNRFRLATVFDVTQTDGTPIVLPSTQLAESVAAATLYSRLGELCEDLGFEVRESSVQHSLADGITRYSAREIVVGDWLPMTERVAVLAHEYGHAVLHGPDDPLGAKYAHGSEHRGLAEVEAEAVAYVLLKAHGIDSTMRSAEYLAGWSDAVREAAAQGGDAPKRSDIVRSVLSRITAASKTALMATDPPSNGGKPAHRHFDLDATATPTLGRGAETGPAAQPTHSRGIPGPENS